jgi:predicted DNA-binding protein (MmcQ/YjbR family)
MTPDELRDHCLSFLGTEETFPFGPENSVFKVAGKIFALSRLDADQLRVSLKCEPALAEQLRAAHAAVIPGYHLSKRHWNTVIIDGSLSDKTIGDMIEDSYDLVVSQLSRVRQRALAWRGDRGERCRERPLSARRCCSDSQAPLSRPKQSTRSTGRARASRADSRESSRQADEVCHAQERPQRPTTVSNAGASRCQ